MEFLIGLCGKDFVLVASDALSARSIMVLSSDTKKLTALGSHTLLACVGEPGETDRLKERLLAETSLAELRMGRAWSTHETAYFSRNLMADALRSRSPFSVHLLLAGMDEDVEDAVHGKLEQGSEPQEMPPPSLAYIPRMTALRAGRPSLYWMDYLAALHRLPYAVHGYGAFFTWGLLDARYRPDLSLEEAMVLIADVLHELQTRFIIQMPKLVVKLIDNADIKNVEVDFATYRSKSPGKLEWKTSTSDYGTEISA